MCPPARVPRPAKSASPATAPMASASRPTIRPSRASTRITSSARCTTTRRVVARTRSWAAWPPRSRPRTSSSWPSTTRSSPRRSPPSTRRTSSCRRTEIDWPLLRGQLLLQEGHDGLLVEVAIRLLLEAVTLVLRGEVPDLASARADLRDHLLRFAGRHARIVETLHDEQRLGDARGIGQRGNALQVGAHLRQPFIAIFRATQRSTIGGRAFEEGHE